MSPRSAFILLVFFVGCGPAEVALRDDPYVLVYRHEELDRRYWLVEFEGPSTAHFSYFPPKRPVTAPTGPEFPYFSTQVTIKRVDNRSFTLDSTAPSEGHFEKSRILDESSDSPFDRVTYRTQLYRLTLNYANEATSVTLEGM